MFAKIKELFLNWLERRKFNTFEASKLPCPKIEFEDFKGCNLFGVPPRRFIFSKCECGSKLKTEYVEFTSYGLDGKPFLQQVQDAISNKIQNEKRIGGRLFKV